MMKKVYICAPLGGDIQGNLEKAKRYTEYALKCGTAPVVSATKSPKGCGVKSISAKISISKPAL